MVWQRIFLALMPSCALATPVELRFCYEDKPLFPYYLGAGAHVPKQNPGATIEHLQQLVDAVPALQLKLQRLPWKRCLAELQQNKVDAVVSSDRPDRRAFAHFPMQGQQPDPRRAFSAHETCLVQRQDAQWRWDGTRLIGTDEIVIGRPLGYAAIPSPPGQTFQMHYTLSGTMDLDLLEKGRIHAVTTLCRIDDQPLYPQAISDRQLKIVQPALHRNTGYLIFSQHFYQQHQAIAEALWQQLALNKGSAIYQRYLQNSLNMPASNAPQVRSTADSTRTQETN